MFCWQWSKPPGSTSRGDASAGTHGKIAVKPPQKGKMKTNTKAPWATRIEKVLATRGPMRAKQVYKALLVTKSAKSGLTPKQNVDSIAATLSDYAGKKWHRIHRGVYGICPIPHPTCSCGGACARGKAGTKVLKGRKMETKQKLLFNAEVSPENSVWRDIHLEKNEKGTVWLGMPTDQMVETIRKNLREQAFSADPGTEIVMIGRAPGWATTVMATFFKERGYTVRMANTEAGWDIKVA